MPKKVDANQPAIVAAFRRMGATVQHLHTLGKGAPDLLIGINGVNGLVEVKDGEKPPSKRRLTGDEQDWHDGWKGQVCIVESIDDAARFVGKLLKAPKIDSDADDRARRVGQ